MIRRDDLFDDIELYQSNSCIMKEFPFQVKFKSEQAIGGVARDAISAFWEHVAISYNHFLYLMLPQVRLLE